MDFMAHMVYGATACSRSGLAGGKIGSASRWYRDGTVWWSAAFGFLPDAVSMGIPFLLFLARGATGNFFRDIDAEWLVGYRFSHSLVAAAALLILIYAFKRRLLIPALAYPLHLITDILTHAGGKFHAPPFYPLSSWSIEGVAWWRHHEVVVFYWALPVAAWLFLYVARRGKRPASSRRTPVT